MRVVAGGHGLGGRGEREQRVAAAVGRRAGVAARPWAVTWTVPAALRRTTDAVLAARRPLAALEAQARVPAREATDVGEVAGAPLLVAHEQQRDLGVRLGALGERAHDADREHVAALHVDGARADQLVALAGERPVVLVRDDGVEVPEQQHRRDPVPLSRASRSGAWSGEEHGTRSISASSGSSAAHTAAHSSAPWMSPDGDETPTSASSSRTARLPISAAAARTQGSMPPDGTVFAMIEAGEKAPEFTLPDQDGRRSR